MFQNRRAGFTLLERLVVLALMGMLAAIVVTNITFSRQASRDGQRVSDLTNIQNALGLYFADTRSYPSTLNSLVPTYLNSLPTDPQTNAQYLYSSIDVNTSPGSCESYHLGAILERSGTSSLGQDADKNVLGSVCTGSSADFYGISPTCSTSVAGSPDQCFDLVSQ